jgi:hypothetical protein
MLPNEPLNMQSVDPIPTDAGAVAPLLVNVKQAAALLGISERTLFSITAPRGDLPCAKVARCVRYRLSDLERFCEERARASETKAR